MSDIGPVKVSKKMFQQLNRLAIKRNYNRSIKPVFFKTVTDKDQFLVQPSDGWILFLYDSMKAWLVHEHARGKLVWPYLRCQVLFCTGGVVGDTVGFLDIPFESYPKQEKSDVE